MILPLKGLLLIRIKDKEADRKSAGGIYLHQEKWPVPENTATVLEVGPTVRSIKKDQIIVINPYAVHETDQKQVKLIDERDVLAIWQSPQEK